MRWMWKGRKEVDHVREVLLEKVERDRETHPPSCSVFGIGDSDSSDSSVSRVSDSIVVVLQDC